MKKHSYTDIFVVGFALFSMFFGAGNVVFPPFLGMSAGQNWLTGLVCYYIADIGLAILAMLSMFKRGGVNAILSPAGRIPATILMCATVLCIGPMLAIPRTAAMTFETSIEPLIPSVGSVVFSIAFFILVFLCSVRESAVVDIVGKVMTPLLLIGLLVLIIKGAVNPLGEINPVPHAANVAGDGIKAGYQTMDVLATLVFGGLILKSAHEKGYTEEKEKGSIAIKSGLVAGAILLIVYTGLTHLGATVSSVYDLSMGRSSLMLAIVEGLMGQKGTVLYALVVALACITTAIGLVSSCAEYFANLFKGKISYAVLVFIICLFSAIVSNVGLDMLISIAAPVLDVVYPPILVLIALSFLPQQKKGVYFASTLCAVIMSSITAISVYGNISMPFLKLLPFDHLGFNWLVPSIIAAFIGYFINFKEEKA